VNLLGDNIDTTKTNMETLIDDSKEIDWSRNKCRENQVYAAISSPECRSRPEHKNSKQIVWKCVSSNIWGRHKTNQNLIQEEIKRRLNSGNACYHSVQSFLSSRLLSKNLKIRIYNTQ
jgi:hypothetical protein